MHPAGGTDHWATFELKDPLALKDGAILKFVIHQQHNAERHVLGRFRLSVTTTPKGWGLSLPESLAAIFSTAQKQRTKEQTDFAKAYFAASDAGRVAKEAAVATAKKPVPEDAGVTRRKAAIARISQPIKDDSVLVQLRKDFEQSKLQLQNRRLTAIQDLAWALINSPAFLFNH